MSIDHLKATYWIWEIPEDLQKRLEVDANANYGCVVDKGLMREVEQIWNPRPCSLEQADAESVALTLDYKYIVVDYYDEPEHKQPEGNTKWLKPHA